MSPRFPASERTSEDFLSRDARAPTGLPAEEACLHRRESYDVTAASGPEGVVQARFAVNDETCPTKALRGSSTSLAMLDMTIYAVDIRTMRILAVGSHVHLRSGEGPPPSP